MNEGPLKIEISGDGLTLEQVASAAGRSTRVDLTSNLQVRDKIFASRQLLENKLETGEIIFGVNTGFGGNVRYLIPSSEITRHHTNVDF